MNRLWILTFSALAAFALIDVRHTYAAPRPCRFGFKGTYVTWNKDTSAGGSGTFEASTGRAPSFLVSGGRSQANPAP